MRHLENYLDPSEILRLFEEKFGTGVWRCDAEGRMQWSRGFYGLLGLDPDAVAPSYAEIERRIHPEDRRPQRDPRELAFDWSLLDGEFRIIRPNRALRWIRIQSETFLNSAARRNAWSASPSTSPNNADRCSLSRQMRVVTRR
ncbi:PAS domain-containing protein [Bradyrhizobium genosp. SA-3]|uniref:PAS domain-containing protein n=1 Tax=Bradyrhizobium genosp. SA-3 TaxID=508868 RepID=UPI001FE0A9C0|nr:PAS domain-containing protein [Bradyrhizobium genosp. SA-3]